MNFNVVFYDPNKLDFAASVYAKERNIFHLAHLGSQGGEGPESNLSDSHGFFYGTQGEISRKKGKKGHSHIH